jgi:hypothetical protein
MSDWIQPGHLFSQHSLNTYLRCQHRFLLTYVERQPWPAPEAEDLHAYQRYLERGTILHHWLVRRHLGIDMEPLVAACGDEDLRRWWRAAQAFDDSALPAAEGGLREAELPIIVSLGAYSLYARYDYVAIGPDLGQERVGDPRPQVDGVVDAWGRQGRVGGSRPRVGGVVDTWGRQERVGDPRPQVDAVILDWKTLKRIPSMHTLRQRVQTRAYLYSLIAAGQVLTGGVPIEPERAEMWYWFANYPEEMVRIPYSQAAYRQDGAWLRDLVAEIATRPLDTFGMTDDLRECRCCHYRTLCNRATGDAQDTTDDSDDAHWLQEEIDLTIDLEWTPDADVPGLER